jgi:hypothetical protein
LIRIIIRKLDYLVRKKRDDRDLRLKNDKVIFFIDDVGKYRRIENADLNRNK